jgi:hypothetical protein
VKWQCPKCRRWVDEDIGRVCADCRRQNERLVTKLLRELVAAEQFDSIPDVREALKERCARLHIRYDGELIDRAVTLVGSNTQLALRPRR